MPRDLPLVDSKTKRLLIQVGIEVRNAEVETLQAYVDLIRQWNAYADLMSPGDFDTRIGLHISDSLSLLPYVFKIAGLHANLLDIGSGGGFPAIPMKILLPKTTVTLIERSERKSAFLQRVVMTLLLANTTVLTGNFPVMHPVSVPNIITARAVEKPAEVMADILTFLPQGAAFLCQGSPDAIIDKDKSSMFHVEPVDDEWSRCGLRRGPLNIVTRIKT